MRRTLAHWRLPKNEASWMIRSFAGNQEMRVWAQETLPLATFTRNRLFQNKSVKKVILEGVRRRVEDRHPCHWSLLAPRLPRPAPQPQQNTPPCSQQPTLVPVRIGQPKCKVRCVEFSTPHCYTTVEHILNCGLCVSRDTDAPFIECIFRVGPAQWATGGQVGSSTPARPLEPQATPFAPGALQRRSARG